MCIPKNKDRISQSELKELLTYNKNTGNFVNKVNRGSKAKKGRIAGSKMKNGYWEIYLKGKRYLAHRLAWFYVYGYFPEHEVEHKNRIKHDNKFVNLREVTHACNMKNTGVRSHSSTKITGVSLNKQTGEHEAYITINKKRQFLSHYPSKIEAVHARHRAELESDWFDCSTESAAYLFIKKYNKRNKPCDLARVDNFFNSKKQNTSKSNTSGVTGVIKSKSGRFQAMIMVNGKSINLGMYATLILAANARKEGEKKHDFYNDLTSSSAYKFCKAA